MAGLILFLAAIAVLALLGQFWTTLYALVYLMVTLLIVAFVLALNPAPGRLMFSNPVAVRIPSVAYSPVSALNYQAFILSHPGHRPHAPTMRAGTLLAIAEDRIEPLVVSITGATRGIDFDFQPTLVGILRVNVRFKYKAVAALFKLHDPERMLWIDG